MSTRPDWNTYFMEIAQIVASRATCIRRSVGAVIIREKQILTTGYNGAPKHLPHCTEKTCLRNTQNIESGTMHELCRGVHAEQNAIIQAAYHGIAIDNAQMYVTTQPCSICTKMIINAGIREVYFKTSYNDPLALKLMQEARIKWIEM